MYIYIYIYIYIALHTIYIFHEYVYASRIGFDEYEYRIYLLIGHRQNIDINVCKDNDFIRLKFLYNEKNS